MVYLGYATELLIKAIRMPFHNSHTMTSPCFIVTLVGFLKLSYFITSIHLFSFLVCLLQVLCRRHPQYRRHQVCPLHRGNYVLNDYSFQLKSHLKRMRLFLCELILHHVDSFKLRVRGSVAFVKKFSRFQSPNIMIPNDLSFSS